MFPFLITLVYVAYGSFVEHLQLNEIWPSAATLFFYGSVAWTLFRGLLFAAFSGPLPRGEISTVIVVWILKYWIFTVAALILMGAYTPATGWDSLDLILGGIFVAIGAIGSFFSYYVKREAYTNRVVYRWKITL